MRKKGFYIDDGKYVPRNDVKFWRAKSDHILKEHDTQNKHIKGILIYVFICIPS